MSEPDHTCLPSFSWNTHGFGIWGDCCKNDHLRQFPTEKWREDQSEFLEHLGEEMMVKKMGPAWDSLTSSTSEWARSVMRQNPTQQTVLMLEQRSWRDASTVCSREGTGLLQGEGTTKQVKAGVGRTKWGGNTNKACHWFQLVLLEF